MSKEQNPKFHYPLGEADHDLLVRIDERTRVFHETIEKRVDKLEKNAIMKKDFFPVKSIVYGAVAVVGTAVLGAILVLIIPT